MEASCRGGLDASHHAGGGFEFILSGSKWVKQQKAQIGKGIISVEDD